MFRIISAGLPKLYYYYFLACQLYLNYFEQLNAILLLNNLIFFRLGLLLEFDC